MNVLICFVLLKVLRESHESFHMNVIVEGAGDSVQLHHCLRAPLNLKFGSLTLESYT